jgi:hypothetical protein
MLMLLSQPVSCASFDCSALVNASGCALVKYLVHHRDEQFAFERRSLPTGLLGEEALGLLSSPRALLIGNNDYVSMDRLRKCANDACDLGDVLFCKGYQVDAVLNAGSEDLQLVVRQFALTLTAAQLAVIYFSGHGIQDGDDNFIVPVDGRVLPPGQCNGRSESYPCLPAVKHLALRSHKLCSIGCW